MHNEVVGGYTGFTLSVRPSVHPSVRPASPVRSVAPTVLFGSILYLNILSSNFRRCVACKVSNNISKFVFLAIFLIFNFDFCLLLTWDPMWITSMGNHGAAGGISERRRSSFVRNVDRNTDIFPYFRSISIFRYCISNNAVNSCIFYIWLDWHLLFVDYIK